MDHREKIKQLVKEGKINSNQAVSLLQSLKESENRREKILKQILVQKKQRQKNAWGFLCVWFMFVLVGISFLIFTVGNQRLSRDENKAILNFNQANNYLANNDYGQAIEYYKRGIRKAPNFSIGYALLGATYKSIYEKSNDQEMLRLSNEALDKASLLTTKIGGAKMTGAGLFFLAIFVLLVLSIISVVLLAFYNTLVRREEKVNVSWAQIGTLYQRRLDLIPALLETVREYAKHESTTLENVIKARNNAQNLIEKISGIAGSSKEKIKELIGSQQQIELGLGKVNALAERYPQLKADGHYLTMHKQIEETVNLITGARQKYNQVVKVYNAGLRLFPMNLMSTFFQFQPKVYFDKDK